MRSTLSLHTHSNLSSRALGPSKSLSRKEDTQEIILIKQHCGTMLPTDLDVSTFPENTRFHITYRAHNSLLNSRDKIIENWYIPATIDMLDILKFAEIKQIDGLRILSIGCGMAEELIALSFLGKNFVYVGIDILNKTIEADNKIFENINNAKFYTVNAEDFSSILSFSENNMFDIVLLFHPNVLDTRCASSFQKIIQQTIPKVLKHDGKLVSLFHEQKEFDIFSTYVSETSLSVINHPNFIVRNGRNFGHVICVQRNSTYYDIKSKTRETQLIIFLKDISKLDFFGHVYDEEFSLDAVVFLELDEQVKVAQDLQTELQSGFFLETQEGKKVFILKSINKKIAAKIQELHKLKIKR